MAWSRWKLVGVNDSDLPWPPHFHRRQPEGTITAMFQREKPRRGGKPPRTDSLLVYVDVPSNEIIIRREHVVQSHKAHQRAQMGDAACQAAAYYELTGSIEGFPEREFF